MNKPLNSENFSTGQVAAQARYQTTQMAKSLIDYPNNPNDTTRLWPGVKEFIEACPYFFISTSNAAGQCNCNFRGGGRGIVTVIDDKTLAFPDYAGNGLLHSTGDMIENSHIGILFINFRHQQRIKVNGTLEIIDSQEQMALLIDLQHARHAQRVIKVTIEYAVLNCARFLNAMEEEL